MSLTVAIVSDGSAVLGLGDIGLAAAMPVMQGNAMLFKEFAGVDAFPLCLVGAQALAGSSWMTIETRPTPGVYVIERSSGLERQLGVDLDRAALVQQEGAV